MITPRVWLILIVLAVLFSACDPAPEPTSTATVPPPVTLTPPASPVFLAGCTTDDLENWLEQTDFLLRDFVSVMNQAGRQEPIQVRATIQRLAQLRDALIAVPAPEGCASEAHILLLNLIYTATNSLQAYANGALTDLSVMQGTIDQALGNLQTMQNTLQRQLEQQYATEQAPN